MMDIDLEAIRLRDSKWYDRRPMQDGAARDRRLLLRYIDEMERLVEDLAIDIGLLRSRVANIAKMPERESPDPQNAPDSTDPGKLSP